MVRIKLLLKSSTITTVAIYVMCVVIFNVNNVVRMLRYFHLTRHLRLFIIYLILIKYNIHV